MWFWELLTDTLHPFYHVVYQLWLLTHLNAHGWQFLMCHWWLYLTCELLLPPSWPVTWRCQCSWCTLELSDNCHDIDENSAKCREKKSCPGQLFITNFVFGSMPAFSSIMYACWLYFQGNVREFTVADEWLPCTTDCGQIVQYVYVCV